MAPKYEWLKIRKSNNEKDYLKNDLGEYISWTEDMPSGWYSAFGEKIIDEINDVLKKGDFTDKYQILQIKEKYGELRWYAGGVPSIIAREYYDTISKYESLSRETCIKCGKKATHMAKGWIVPICDNCDK